MALLEFDGIAAEADAIVFSRGNLGLDVAPEKMARVQKCVLIRCHDTCLACVGRCTSRRPQLCASPKNSLQSLHLSKSAQGNY